MSNVRIERIFAAATEGQYSLPEDVYELAAARDSLEERRRDLSRAHNDRTKQPRWVENDLVGDAVADARAGELADDYGARLLEAEEAERRTAAQARIFTAAVETANANILNAIASRADEIISDHLRPALTETMREAEKAAEELDGMTPDPAIILTSGTDKQRNAYRKLTELSKRYTAIRSAFENLTRTRLSKPIGGADLFAEFRNASDFVTHRAHYAESNAAHLPWPSDPVARLCWIVANGAEAWVPTLEEQNTAAQNAAQPEPEEAKA